MSTTPEADTARGTPLSVSGRRDAGLLIDAIGMLEDVEKTTPSIILTTKLQR